MNPESLSNNLFNLILENIVPILIVLFLIISRLTKVKKTSEEPERTFSQTENEEEDRVREELRHLIKERQSPHTQEHTPSSHPHHQAHADESVLTKTGSHFPAKSAAHTDTEKHTTPYTRAEAHVTENNHHTLSYEDYSYQLAEQQQKIERARAIRNQVMTKELTSTPEMTEVKPKTAARTLNQIFANKSPLQQAILAKEILDQPLALRSKHLS